MFHGHSYHFQKSPLGGGRPNTKPEDHGTPNAHNRWLILFYHVWRPAWIEIPWNDIWLRAQSHMTSLLEFEGILWLSLDTFFGLSQFHGHGSWLVFEVALQVVMKDVGVAKLKLFRLQQMFGKTPLIPTRPGLYTLTSVTSLSLMSLFSYILETQGNKCFRMLSVRILLLVVTFPFHISWVARCFRGTLFCLINVGYQLELRIAITFYS
jgi:hypothetical protein